jgi:hypothetical protein
MYPPSWNRTVSRSLVFLLLVYVLVLDTSGNLHLVPSLLNGVLFLVASALAVALHEGGHALAALAAGLRPFAILVGGGPRIWSGYVGYCHVTIGLLPGAGVTMIASPDKRSIRSRLAITYLGGPLATAACLASALGPGWQGSYGATVFPTVASSELAPWGMFALVNAIFLAVSVLPWRNRRSGEPAVRASDGWRLFALPWLSDAHIDSIDRAWVASEIARLIHCERLDEAVRRFEGAEENSAPRDDFVRLLGATAYLLQEDFAKGRQLLVAAVPGEIREGRAIRLNALAWADVMLEDPALLAEADRFSEEALAVLPKHPALRGTRGAVLVAMGRPGEAVPHLRYAKANQASPRSKGYNAAWLALARAALGDPRQARAELEEATRLNAESVATRRARRVVDAVVEAA